MRVSGLPDDKAVSSGFHDFNRDNLGVVEAQNTFNLRETPCEKAQVASGHSNQSRHDFRGLSSLSGRVTIAKFAILAGMRPGEICAFIWGEMNETYVSVRQPIYKGIIDTPKTEHLQRKAASSEGLLEKVEAWRRVALGFSRPNV